MVIGAAWVKESKKGEKFFSCIIEIPLLGKMNFSIFKIKEKKDKGPDYQITWMSPKSDVGTKEGNPFKDDNVPF